jgi:predicted acylesterase/phospholipase RssA
MLMRILPNAHRPAESTKFQALALSGGGMKGIATMGALLEFQKAGWLDKVHRFAGTSVGAVLAAALALDLDIEDVYKNHVLAYKYTPSYDLSGLDTTFGLDTGKGLVAWIDAVLQKPITFENVRRLHGSTLLVCATNLNTREAVYFGPDTHPTMDVATALKMSCSIPLYFAATPFEGALFVDGALTQNFPFEEASNHGTYKVLGVRLKSVPKPPRFKWTLESFLGALVECTIHKPIDLRTGLVLDLEAGPGTQPMNFKMTSQRMNEVFASGRTQAKEFVHAYLKKVV